MGRAALSGGVALALALTVALGLGAVASAAPSQAACVGEHTVSDARVVAPDGVELAITLFRSGHADCAPTPVVLHQHGWSGSRATSLRDDLVIRGDLAALLDAGYSVVSIDARGHGDSGGHASVLHPDDELSGYRAILDHLHDHVDWIQRETTSGLERDLVVGAYGASYGGGFQTLIAAFDDRLDAIVPIATWHDLARALAPNGVPRGAWVDLLYAAGEARVDLDPRIRRWALEVAATGRVPPDAERHFREASPVSRPGAIEVPALWLHGTPDTLFPLNEAVDNHLDLRSRGVESWLLGANGGHLLPGVQPTGVGAPERDPLDAWSLDDCVDPVPHVVGFLDAFLRDDPTARDHLARSPRALVATEQGGCVAAEDWPLADEEITVELGTLTGGAVLLVELFTAEEETVLAGIGEVELTVPVGTDGTVFLSLVLHDPEEGAWVIDDQVTPVRVDLGDGGAFRTALAGIATVVPPGGSVHLRLETANEQFVSRAQTAAPTLVLEDVTARLPHATEGLTRVGSARQPGGSRGSVGPRPTVAAADAAALPATGGGVGLVGFLLLALALPLVRVTRRPVPPAPSPDRSARSRPPRGR